MSIDLPPVLRSLQGANGYPHPVQPVKVIETHISWVFLTGEFAYKIKRPVVLPFVDLSRREHREFLCHEELRLNRRFAPDLYLEVCPVTLVAGEARIGGTGEAVEHAVKMRQFPQQAQLDHLLAQSSIEPEELRQFGIDLAVVHRQLPAAGHTAEWGQPSTSRDIIVDNLEQCAQAAQGLGERGRILALQQSMLHHLESCSRDLSRRFQSGKVRECHGDLHAGNVVRLGAGLLAFDCLEFDPRLRWIDVADEIAFLVADLEAIGCPVHAHAFLSGYLDESGDFGACRVLNLYKAHKALVRAKVLALSSSQAESTAPGRRFASYVECARASLQPQKPHLILMAGLSGSGKSWLAERLAPRLRAVHIRSDIERKRLAGMIATQRSPSQLGTGLYAASVNSAVYSHLARCVRCVLEGGLNAIADATFQRQSDRETFRQLAVELALPVRVVHCHAPEGVLEERILQRTRERTDPSEADVSVLRWQTQHFESIQPAEGLQVISASTQEAGIVDRVIRELSSSP